MKLIYYPNEILASVCEEVTEFNEDLSKLIDEMTIIMLKHDGMGLSANQIGVKKRIFIMKDLKNNVKEFINPKITLTDGEQLTNEGCLSAPGIFVKVPRYEQVTVEAQNRNGETFKIGAIGIESVCIQHEIEHLDGKFFLDKLNRAEKRRIIKKIKK